MDRWAALVFIQDKHEHRFDIFSTNMKNIWKKGDNRFTVVMWTFSWNRNVRSLNVSISLLAPSWKRTENPEKEVRLPTSFFFLFFCSLSRKLDFQILLVAASTICQCECGRNNKQILENTTLHPPGATYQSPLSLLPLQKVLEQMSSGSKR